MQEIGAHPARDCAKRLNLLPRIANPQGVVGIDQIDDAGILIDGLAELLRRQPVSRRRIVDRNLANFGAGLPGELHRPFPAGVGRDKIGLRLAIRATNRRQRRYGAVTDHRCRRIMREPQIGDDGIEQRRKSSGRRVGVKFFRINGVDQRLTHRRVHRQVIGVLAEPEQARSSKQPIEMRVALGKAAHCRFGRGLMIEP